MSATRTKAKAEDTSPQPPQSTPVQPVQHGYQDHSFTLQAIMELQKSVGEMNANLQALKTSVDGVKGKVDDLVNWKHKIIGGAAVAGAIIAVLAFLATKAADYVSIKTPSTQVTPVSPPSQATQGKKP
jgi:hypothetical protein